MYLWLEMETKRTRAARETSAASRRRTLDARETTKRLGRQWWEGDGQGGETET